MITPLPGAVPTKPGLGDAAVLRHRAGSGDARRKAPVPAGRADCWSCASPGRRWLRTVYGDPERYEKTYWTDVPGYYFTGDGARRTPTATSG